VWVEYNPVNMDFNQGHDDVSLSGFSFGYSQAFSVASGKPLFLEAGLGVQYSFTSDFMDIDDANFSMFSLKIPVNLIYSFQIPNSAVSINPFVGLNLRYNVLGKITNDEDDDDDLDLFDKDEMGGSSNTFKRFQAGWHIGVKARFGESFMAGVSYGSDFSNIWEPKISGDKQGKAGISTTTLTIGFCF